MDNAQCRNNLIIINILKNFINGLYFPPYSPEMNLIELVFNKFKTELQLISKKDIFGFTYQSLYFY